MTFIDRIAGGPPGHRRFTGRHMAAVIALFFGVIISVNLVLAYFATSTWTGLVVKNSYVESQHFNAHTAEKLRQAEMGWQDTTRYGDGVFEVGLIDRNKTPIRDAIVVAKIGRPAHENEDRTLQMIHDQNGVYRAETELGTGIWQADLSVTGPAGETWTRAVRFLVRDGD